VNIFKITAAELTAQGFELKYSDFDRPWGGFFVIDENQTDKFMTIYFPRIKKKDLVKGQKVSPKILLVAPEKRLSWQYHYRRSEVWRIIEGEVGVIRSYTDEEGELEIFKAGDIIILEKKERHRLVGLSNWGKVAEIWQHTESNCPSTEDDIVRLQDDFGR
jgi:mannose-6-phosphate isomerase-like protein (cupin superfamily)